MYLCAAVFFRNFLSFHIGLILGRGEGGGKGGGREGGEETFRSVSCQMMTLSL